MIPLSSRLDLYFRSYGSLKIVGDAHFCDYAQIWDFSVSQGTNQAHQISSNSESEVFFALGDLIWNDPNENFMKKTQSIYSIIMLIIHMYSPF